MFMRLFFLATLAVFVATQGFSSGVFIPKLTHQTKIKRPVQKQVPEQFVFEVAVGDKGQVKKVTLKGCVDKTDASCSHICPSNKEIDMWVQAIQREVKKYWKYEPKMRFAMHHIMDVDLVVTDEDFHPLTPRR